MKTTERCLCGAMTCRANAVSSRGTAPMRHGPRRAPPE
jgi:hypothetical protein